MPPTLELKNVLITAEDMGATLADFETLGADVAFRDGDSYAVLDPGQTCLGIAMAAPHDHPAPGELVLTAKAAHVRAAAEELVSSGAEMVSAPQQGTHEIRALVRTPGGLLLMIYGPQE